MADVLEAPHVRASAKHLHVSPNKVRQVLALIRGLAAEDAERVLQLCQKDAAGDVLKVLDAAVANAEHNRSLPIDELYIARAYADEGPTRKWGQPRARGRYFRVRHRTSHLTIVLARFDEDELEEKRRREEAAAAASGRGRGAQRRRAERVRKSRAAQRGDAHDHDHDHDHDEEHDHAEVEETEASVSTEAEATAPEAAEEAEPETDTDADDDAGETDATEAPAAEDEEEGE
jgi:large subunit ribosomal protein L22